MNAGALRTQLIDALGGLARDAVITGLDRDFVGAIVIPDLAACRVLAAGTTEDTPVADILDDDRVRADFGVRLAALARQSTGSSTLVRRIILFGGALSIDKGEVTDKGSLNQRAVIANHPDLVEEIYAGSPRVIAFKEGG